MSGTPSGTVTFLFTDIEGSTRLWQDHPADMPQMLAAHDGLVRSAIDRFHGYVFATGGDSFSAAFDNPAEAAEAAVAIHSDIDLSSWGDAGRPAVRIGLETGHAEQRDGGYFGMPLNRAARIRDLADGSEILCSETTADLLRGDPSFPHRLGRVGRRHLRSVDGTETLFRISPRSASPVGARGLARWVVAVVGITLLTLGWWLPLETAPPTTTQAPPTDDESPPVDPPRWSIQVGAVTSDPMILGDAVFVGTSDGVAAIGLESGELRWLSTTSRPPETLATDGEFVFATTRDRLYVLHPTSGDTVPRCGFALPVALAHTSVGPGEVFVMSGSLLRIETHPRAADCHAAIRENPTSAGGLAPVVGPITTEHFVVIADGTGVHGFDPETVELMWQYPDLIGPAPTALAAAESGERSPSTVTAEVLVATTDDTGILSLVRVDDDGSQLLSIEPTRVDPEMPLLAGDHAVIAVDASHHLIGFDPGTAVGVWERDDFAVSSGPVTSGGWVFAAGPDGLHQIDPIDGRTIAVLHLAVDPRRLAVRSDRAIVVDSTDGIHLFELALDAGSEVWRPPPDRPLQGAETVAREFLRAWNGGDRQTVEQLLGPDAAVTTAGLPSIWSAEAQERLWAWFEAELVMKASWEVAACVVTEIAPTTFEVVCDSTYTNSLMAAAGGPVEPFTTSITVTNGVVTRTLGGANVSGPGYGGVFTDLGGRWDVYDGFSDWASKTHPVEFRETCEREHGMGPACARFIVSHEDEWASPAE